MVSRPFIVNGWGPHLPAATCVGKCNIGYPQPVFRTGLGPGVSPFNHICLALLASELHCVGRALSASGLKCVVWLTCIPSTLLRYARSELNYVARWGARKGLTSRASAARGTRVVKRKNTTSQPTSQPASQPASQPTSQPANSGNSGNSENSGNSGNF